jgi:hypothetical protein
LVPPRKAAAPPPGTLPRLSNLKGVDRLRSSLSAVLNRGDIRFHYEEIVEHSPYDQADRIAVIGLVIDRIA